MSLPQAFPRLFAIGAACERIMELEDLPSQPEPDQEKVRSIYATMNGFTAEHLSFAYDRELVMKDVSITVPKGGLTVIVGQSGIGKSTLLKLLLGLYRPNSGTLVIDTPEGPIPVDRGTRSLFSYAPQGNFLLSGTLRENLTFTNPDATDEEIHAALYASAMDEYVATLPQGLETLLRENGAGLSEGQAQRLSLARAIISGAPVLLLDEVTSALDAVTEQTVLERITALPGMLVRFVLNSRQTAHGNCRSNNGDYNPSVRFMANSRVGVRYIFLFHEEFLLRSEFCFIRNRAHALPFRALKVFFCSKKSVTNYHA